MSDTITEIGTTEFVVSRKDIENGKIRCGDRCPLALSLYQHVKDLQHNYVTVFDEWIRFGLFQEGYIDDYYHVYISTDLQKWIKDYDNDKDVDPIRIFLDTNSPACFHMQHESRPYLRWEDTL